MPNYCIAVDSACDLPHPFIVANNVKVLPITVLIDGQIFRDFRDPKTTLDFYAYYGNHKDGLVQTSPLTVDEMSTILEEELLHHYDGTQVITINAERSKIYDNVREAALIKLPKLKALHRDVTGSSQFRLRVFNSTTMFTGQAIIAHEAVRLLRDEGLELERLEPRLAALADQVYAYVVPRDLYYLHARAREKGDNSVGWFSYKVGNLLNVKPVVQCYRGVTEPAFKAAGFDAALQRLFARTLEAIDQGLVTPLVAMSYGGDLEEIRANSHYIDFVNAAQARGVDLLLSLMSTTAAVNVGPRAFSLAFAQRG